MQLIVEKKGYRLLPLLALVLAVAALVLFSRDTVAVHDDGLFELDVEVPGASPPCPEDNQGNPIIPCSNANTADDSGAGAPYDWESVCEAIDPPTDRTITEILPEPTGVGQSACIADWALPDSTTFATGSKDIGDIAPGGFVGSGTWACAKDNNVLEKNEIMNAYAALMTNPDDDHDQLYFGLERPSNNGTSFMGFWFLLNEVECVGPNQGAANWTGGLHSLGDLLLLSDFSGGGRVSSVRVLQWNPNNDLGLAQCAPGGGNLIPDANIGPLCEVVPPGQDCSTAPPDDDVCAGVNAEAVLTPWWNQPKAPPCSPTKGGTQAAPGTTAPCTVPLQTNTLFEGGIDLTEVLCPGETPCDLPCFSTFVAETRSSDTETADLKDFARGAFDICGKATIIKQTDPADADGTFTYTSGLPCDDFSLIDADSTPAVGEDGVHQCADLPTGTYYVTEDDPTQGTPPFDLVNIVCTVDVNPDGNTSYRIGRFDNLAFVNGGTDLYDAGDDTVELNISTLGEITCTYTNRQRGSILVRKEDEDGNLLPGACFTFDPDPADGLSAAVEVCDDGVDTNDHADADDGFVCVDEVILGDYDITESEPPPGYEADPDTQTVTVDSPSTCADRLADTPVPDATFVNKLGTILIHKVSTKTDTFVDGACFTIDDDPLNELAFSGTVCDDDFAAATLSDTDATDGVICVEDVPLGDYDVTESTVPDGYAGDDDIVPVTVDDSESCADKAATPDAEFQNIPLADIQVNFRDAGSGETSLDVPIDCDNSTGTESTTDATGWEDTLTIEDIEIDPSPQTIVCTIVIDP
jgi:hypothetical protein